MINSEIRPALEAMRAMEFNKIKDDGIRAALENNFFFLSDCRRKLDNKIETLKDMFLSKFKAKKDGEIGEDVIVEKLQGKLAIADADEAKEISRELLSHEKYFDEQSVMNRKVAEILKEEITGYTIMDRKRLMEAMRGQEKFTLAWIDALYPLIGTDKEEKK